MTSTEPIASAENRRPTMPLLGRYRLVEELGSGGMGVVYLGLDPGGRAVAIKMLRPHAADDPQARARLQREVDTLGRITDPRVASVIDAELDAAAPYLVTRFVAGPSLEDFVGDSGPVPAGELVRVARELAGAIGSIHGAGVVHRDVKPSNVLIDDDGGRPVLIDFGIAHLTDDVRITLTGLVMGTPGYLSPEVINGGAVTPATDWWGWAATLAFAATGRPPFGKGPMELVLARVRAGEADLAGVDPRLAPLLQWAMTIDPAARPSSGEVLAALERYAGGDTVTVPVGSSATRVMPVGPPVTEPVRATIPSPPSPAVWPAPPAPRSAPASSSSAGPAPASRPAQPSAYPSATYPVQVPYADPRIDRDLRKGAVWSLGALLVALAAAAPLIAVGVGTLWRWIAGTSDRVVTSMVVRRHLYGSRRSDVAVAVLRSPWHLVVAALGTAVSLLLPLVVGVATTFTVALALRLAFGGGEPDHPVALAVGMAAALAMAWLGPGGASLRRGSRSVLRGLSRGPLTGSGALGGSAASGGGLTGGVFAGANAWHVVCLLGAAAAVVWLAARGWVPTWWPLSSSPWAGLLVR
jgi:serine/threonine protein kinase